MKSPWSLDADMELDPACRYRGIKGPRPCTMYSLTLLKSRNGGERARGLVGVPVPRVVSLPVSPAREPVSLLRLQPSGLVFLVPSVILSFCPQWKWLHCAARGPLRFG